MFRDRAADQCCDDEGDSTDSDGGDGGVSEAGGGEFATCGSKDRRKGCDAEGDADLTGDLCQRLCPL